MLVAPLQLVGLSEDLSDSWKNRARFQNGIGRQAESPSVLLVQDIFHCRDVWVGYTNAHRLNTFATNPRHKRRSCFAGFDIYLLRSATQRQQGAGPVCL